MVFVFFLLAFFISTDSWAAASKSLALCKPAQVETQRQKEIREQFFPGENQRRVDTYLEVTGLPYDMFDLIRSYLRDDREFWVASVASQTVVEEGAINVFTVGTQQAPYVIFQMADYSLKVKKVTASGIQLVATLVGHAAPLTCVAISPQGRYLCAAAQDQYFKVWDLQTCECKRNQRDGWVTRNIEFLTKGNAFYLITSNGIDGLETYIPLGDEPAFGQAPLDPDDIPGFYGFENLSKDEVIFTIQDLGAGKSFIVTEDHCLVYDRNLWKVRNTHPSLRALPEDLLAGRISETYKSTLFLLTEKALCSYYFDHTKQESAQLRTVQKIKKIKFSFPAHVMLSDDGRFCAGVTKNYFDLWDLAHETRLYHVPISENKVVQVNKLFFSPQGQYFSLVDDKTKQVTCHFFDADIAQHLYALTLGDSEFIQRMVQKNNTNSADALMLHKRERSYFFTLPACVQENLERNCRLDIRRPWGWRKNTLVTAASLVVLDFVVSRFITKKPMVIQKAWRWILHAAASSKRACLG